MGKETKKTQFTVTYKDHINYAGETQFRVDFDNSESSVDLNFCKLQLCLNIGLNEDFILLEKEFQTKIKKESKNSFYLKPCFTHVDLKYGGKML